VEELVKVGRCYNENRTKMSGSITYDFNPRRFGTISGLEELIPDFMMDLRIQKGG
jgi:hypothetical protein